MQIHRADTAADMRRDIPAGEPTKPEVVDQVGHERVGIAIPSRIEVDTLHGDAADPVLTVTKFLFESPRPPLVARTGADVEAVLEMLGTPDAAGIALGVVQHGPAAFATYDGAGSVDA